MSRAALAAPLLVAVLCLASPALADESGVVNVVRTRESAAWIDEATSRVAGELRAVGFRVRVIDRRQPGAAAGPVDAAREVATVAIVATPAGVEADVWVADKVSDTVRVKRVVEADVSAPNAASDLAVRSVELLRASLLEATPKQRAALAPPVVAWLAAAPSQTPKAAPPPTPSAPTPPPTRARPSHAAPASTERRFAANAPSAPRFEVTVQAALGVLTGPGAGLAVAPAIVRAGVVHRSGLGARVTGVEALGTTRTGGAGASIDVRQGLVAFDATYAFAPPHALLAPHVSAGGGVFVLDADGRAALPAHGLHPRFATGFLDAGAGVALRLAPRLALVADVDALVMPSEPEVTIDGNTSFRTGRPTVLASVGLDAHF